SAGGGRRRRRPATRAVSSKRSSTWSPLPPRTRNGVAALFSTPATEFPEPEHPARAVILANKRAVRERLQALATAAGARDATLLAQQLQLLIDGAYAIGQSLGPAGPAKTVAGAGRALIAAQLSQDHGAP